MIRNIHVTPHLEVELSIRNYVWFDVLKIHCNSVILGGTIETNTFLSSGNGPKLYNIRQIIIYMNSVRPEFALALTERLRMQYRVTTVALEVARPNIARHAIL